MPFIRTLLAVLAVTCLSLAHAQTDEAGERSMRVNVNTADAQTIARVLTGVGLKKAQAIVEHRDRNGRFDTPADLTKVKGIGESTVQSNADKILIGAGSPGNKDAEPGSNTAMAANDQQRAQRE